MAKIEETATRLSVTIGLPSFNGTIAVFDKETGRAEIQVTNFFFKGKKDVALEDIEGVKCVATKSATFPRILLKDRKSINMPSAGITDGRQATAAIERFLGIA